MGHDHRLPRCRGRGRNPSTIDELPVLVIESSAFEGNGQAANPVARVVVPSSVTSIGSSAFNGRSALAGVTFEGNAPSVGAVAFLFVGMDPKAYRAAGLTGYGDDGATFHGLIVATPVMPAN